MSDVSRALVIFGFVYPLIMAERIRKTIVAQSGAVSMIGLGVVSEGGACYSHEQRVEYNVVRLWMRSRASV